MTTPPELLLIDDDVHASMLRKRVLETKGYRVQLALDGPNGVALAEALRPALILLDHAIGDTSGYGGLVADYDPAPDAFLQKGGGVQQLLDAIESLL